MSRLLKFSRSWAWVTPTSEHLLVHRFSTLPTFSRNGINDWVRKRLFLQEGILQMYPYGNFYYFKEDHLFSLETYTLLFLSGESTENVSVFPGDTVVIDGVVSPLEKGHIKLPKANHLLRYDPDTLSFLLVPSQEGRCYISRPQGIFTQIRTDS